MSGAAREGKWARFVDELPKLPAGLDAERRGNKEYLERVELKKAEYAGVGATGVAKEYDEARGEKEALEDALKPVNLRLVALAQAIEEKFAAEGLKSAQLADGASIGVQYEPYASVEDRRALLEDVFRESLEGAALAVDGARVTLLDVVKEAVGVSDDHGGPNADCEATAAAVVEFLAKALASHGLSASLAFPWQTLNSMLKESLEEGREPPPGVKAFMLPKVVRRGAR